MYIEGYTGDPDVFIGERPPAGLATLTMNKTLKYCALCFITKDLRGWSTRGKAEDREQCPDRVATDGVDSDDSEILNRTCRVCFLLRRPCVWVKTESLLKIGTESRLRYIRSPLVNLQGEQTIPGPVNVGGPIADDEEDE